MSGVRASLVASATALALSRGGTVLCADLIVRLAEAVDSLPGLAPDDPIRPLFGPVSDVITARLDGDENAFHEGRNRLQIALAVYWAGKAATLGVRT